ncbi:MAG: group I truncated hemoglobin [Gammaproteobacteria bacterium]
MPRLGHLYFIVLLLAGCAPEPQAIAEETLFERLGGKDAITAVADDFVGNVGADARINHYFENTDLGRLRQLLVEQICEGSGGPCKYSGRDMRSTHAHLGITESDFNALVEDLIKSLDKFKVPQKEKDELLAVLGPMKADIVTR